jgi:hypothetical protein
MGEQPNCPATVDFYFQLGCDDCAYVKKEIIPVLHDDGFVINEYDTHDKKNFLRLLSHLNQFANESNESVYLVIGDSLLLAGREQITNWIQQRNKRRSEDAIPTEVAPTTKDSNSLLHDKTEQLTYVSIAVAGLLDGINPCVFSTLVFLISLLLISQTTPNKLLLAGSSYCLACFLTYFILGIGLFQFLKLFWGYYYLQLFFEWVLIAFLLIYALLSFRDAFRFKRSGMASSVTLQLPDRIKTIIHAIMRNVTRSRYIIPCAFVAGVLVTLLESVCTGQVYVPMLVLMAKESRGASRWIFYLLFYNFMFILPLLFLFIAVWRGSTMPALLKWSKKNVIFAKIALGCFFIILSGLIILTL